MAGICHRTVRNYFRNSGGSVKTFQMQSLSGTDRSVHRSSQGHSDPAPVIFLLLPKVLPFKVSDTACIIVALVINSSSYVAEVIRAGIQAVDKGQMEAAKSLGLSNKNAMRYVILPQAVKNILPALGNEFVVMVKETSLASVFFVGELMTSYKTVQSTTFLAIPSLTIVGIIYFILNFILTKILKVVERRLQASD